MGRGRAWPGLACSAGAPGRGRTSPQLAAAIVERHTGRLRRRAAGARRAAASCGLGGFRGPVPHPSSESASDGRGDPFGVSQGRNHQQRDARRGRGDGLRRSINITWAFARHVEMYRARQPRNAVSLPSNAAHGRCSPQHLFRRAARACRFARSLRRLRREGKVLGVIYGGGEDPIAFQVDARDLRQVLAHRGAVLDLSVSGAGSPRRWLSRSSSRHRSRGDIAIWTCSGSGSTWQIQATVIARARRQRQPHLASRKAGCSSRSPAS